MMLHLNAANRDRHRRLKAKLYKIQENWLQQSARDEEMVIDVLQTCKALGLDWVAMEDLYAGCPILCGVVPTNEWPLLAPDNWGKWTPDLDTLINPHPTIENQNCKTLRVLTKFVL